MNKEWERLDIGHADHTARMERVYPRGHGKSLCTSDKWFRMIEQAKASVLAMAAIPQGSTLWRRYCGCGALNMTVGDWYAELSVCNNSNSMGTYNDDGDMEVIPLSAFDQEHIAIMCPPHGWDVNALNASAQLAVTKYARYGGKTTNFMTHEQWYAVKGEDTLSFTVRQDNGFDYAVDYTKFDQTGNFVARPTQGWSNMTAPLASAIQPMATELYVRYSGNGRAFTIGRWYKVIQETALSYHLYSDQGRAMSVVISHCDQRVLSAVMPSDGYDSLAQQTTPDASLDPTASPRLSGNSAGVILIDASPWAADDITFDGSAIDEATDEDPVYPRYKPELF